MTDRDLPREVRQRLTKPAEFARALGLKPDHATQTYALVLCPTHSEDHASCSIHKAKGVLRARCPACDWNIGLFDFIALVHGLNVGTQFREVLAIGCEVAGMQAEADQLRGGKKAPPRKPLPLPAPEPDRDYPPLPEVLDLWLACSAVTEDDEACAALTKRKIDPRAVARFDAARVLRADAHHERVPRWARFRGRLPAAKSWCQSGHRLLVPVYDAGGQMRSLRAWRIGGDDSLPKRVPPSGHRASGLVLANARAQRWLRGDSSPSSVVVCEGEPDWLVRAVTFPSETIVGIGSGSWTDDFAARVPFGSEVTILTHLDGAGDKYAEAIEKSVRDRAQVFRWTVTEPEAAA